MAGAREVSHGKKLASWKESFVCEGRVAPREGDNVADGEENQAKGGIPARKAKGRIPTRKDPRRLAHSVAPLVDYGTHGNVVQIGMALYIAYWDGFLYCLSKCCHRLVCRCECPHIINESANIGNRARKCACLRENTFCCPGPKKERSSIAPTPIRMYFNQQF